MLRIPFPASPSFFTFHFGRDEGTTRSTLKTTSLLGRACRSDTIPFYFCRREQGLRNQCSSE